MEDGEARWFTQRETCLYDLLSRALDDQTVPGELRGTGRKREDLLLVYYGFISDEREMVSIR